jgi:hypothetical protein
MQLSDFGKDDSEIIKSRIKVIRNMGIVIYFEDIIPEKVFIKPQLLLYLFMKRF